MAECHPVAFQWVMEAKAHGAVVIHVDPRFTRTSAVSDIHVPIRAGADIAFVGGLINYVLENEKYFKEYVVAYTNAATIVTEEFADTEDLDGVFSGLNTTSGTTTSIPGVTRARKSSLPAASIPIPILGTQMATAGARPSAGTCGGPHAASRTAPAVPPPTPAPTPTRLCSIRVVCSRC